MVFVLYSHSQRVEANILLFRFKMNFNQILKSTVLWDTAKSNHHMPEVLPEIHLITLFNPENLNTAFYSSYLSGFFPMTILCFTCFTLYCLPQKRLDLTFTFNFPNDKPTRLHY